MITAWSAYGPNVVELETVHPERLKDWDVKEMEIWAPEETADMVDMLKFGMSAVEIGVHLNRTTASVISKMRRTSIKP